MSHFVFPRKSLRNDRRIVDPLAPLILRIRIFPAGEGGNREGSVGIYGGVTRAEKKLDSPFANDFDSRESPRAYARCVEQIFPYSEVVPCVVETR